MRALNLAAVAVLLLAAGCTLLSTPEVVYVTATPDLRAVVADIAVFARECPSFKCEVLCRADRGVPLVVVAHNDQMDDLWLQVDHEGQLAWIRASGLNIPDATLEEMGLGGWSAPLEEEFEFEVD